MIHHKIEYSAEDGFARPVNRGINIGDVDLAGLVYQALGDAYLPGVGKCQKNITVVIEFDVDAPERGRCCLD